MPKCIAVGDGVEEERLFHAGIAVRGDDEDGAGKRSIFARNANDDVVVKLALRPMVYELVATESPPNLVEKRPQAESICELLRDGRHHRL